MEEFKEPTEEEIAKARLEREALSEMRKKHQFNGTNEQCPNCEHYPLETQVYGYERSIFCVNCPYERSEEM